MRRSASVPALLPPGWTGLGNGPSYAEHYNGRTWRRVHLPGVPLDVQALARNDIWAYGPTNRTASAENQDIVAMHWNGRGWSTLPIPRMRFGNGKLMFPSGLTVLKGNSLWVTEEFHCPTLTCDRCESWRARPSNTQAQGRTVMVACGSRCRR